MRTRTIKAQHLALRDDIGDLITRRPLPSRTLAQVDPFLFLNHHGPQVYGPNNRGLPFGPHPHRGFETVTFILEGSLSHSDTGGHESIIHAGGVQWMTAGSGLVHAELSPEEFKRSGGQMEILQLWVNLPSRLKMTAPRYVGLQRDQIPSIAIDSAVTLNLVSGRWHEHQGAIEPLLDIFMSSLEFAPGGRVSFEVQARRNIFLYLIRGDLRIGERLVPEHHLIQFNNDGERLDLFSPAGGKVLFGHAEPLGESVVAHGPFVMNTREEIHQAIQDYQAGRFERTIV
jgi:quercetin 2,3-dioxygenase